MNRSERLLLLDVGGVLFRNILQPEWWQRQSRIWGVSESEIVGIYDAELKLPLWTGRLSPADFLERLAQLFAPDDPGAPILLESAVLADLQPLPAASRVVAWARLVRVALLSDHVSPWLERALTEAGIRAALEFLVVSDKTGLLKPDPRAFEAALDLWTGAPGGVLFVDDRPRNLAIARQSGMQAVHADPRGDWIGGVEAWIAN